ncbi:glycosyltransferase family 4 protein [Microbacterium sp. Leaf179]|uniref:glycosyltransferase family 4 protein n=1 Tax=Microbacterium sp. Leaf179 TaxID=1736288 RepID=UPI0006F3677F|nr:glycosyltransferase family 4 protein [Microbacterium sp. Leaf179]KQR86913.1 hypothetical protein ASF96_11430 [Microbacterium sp. Leaf179]
MTAPAPRRVLHLVDRVTGGVPVAVRTYVANSPAGVDHIIAAPFSDGAPAAVWEGTTASHREWDTASMCRAVLGLRHLLRTASFDVVHAHSTFPGAYLRLWGAPRRARVVYTPHCYAFVRTDVAPPVRAAFRAVETLLRGRATVVAACGPGESAEALGLGVAPERIVTVPNVSSLPDAAAPIAARRARTAATSLRVGMLGRWAAQKDPDYFRARVQELRAALAAPVEARWIGSADGAAAAAGHDEPRVHVTGWLPATEVGAQLRELDLYLHTAAWEGFPIALLDAHAVGAPILARAIPALPGLAPALTIEQGLGGFVDAVRAGRLGAWSAANHAAWSAYLGDRTARAQRVALERAWFGEVADGGSR